jgi:hypothetical protein
LQGLVTKVLAILTPKIEAGLSGFHSFISGPRGTTVTETRAGIFSTGDI